MKYEYRSDIRDRAALEKNFRKKFDALNHVHLTDGEFQRLLDAIVTPDVFTAARPLPTINSFTRDARSPPGDQHTATHNGDFTGRCEGEMGGFYG